MNCKLLLLVVLATCSLARTSHASDRFFDSKGVKIRYITEGSGEPVVLVHGWMSDVAMWGHEENGQIKLASSPGFQLIAFDCRGHGKSDKPHDLKAYGAEMAEDVVRLLDHLKVRKAHLVGYSMGAYIVGKVAATHPDRVLSAVYGGQSPLIEGAQTYDTGEAAVFAKAVEEGKGLGPYIIEVSPAEHKPTLAQANAMADFLYKGKDVVAWAMAGRTLKGLEVTESQLQRCKAPILFIYGDHDSQTTQNRVASLRKSLGRGELKVIANANHMTTLLSPEFGATILDFLKASRSH